MKFILTIFWICFSISLGLAQTARNVLVEEFTQASCVPCASQNPDFNKLLLRKADKVIPIKYQVAWPGFDPMYESNPDEVDQRVDFYAVEGVPEVRTNGVLVPERFNYEGAPSDLTEGDIDMAYNNLTPLHIELNHNWLGVDSIEINIRIYNSSNSDFTNENLHLFTALVEKEIIFPIAPGSNGEKDFSWVMRKMIPSASGLDMGSLTIKAHDSLFIRQTVALPGNFYSKGQIAALTFAQDILTYEVIQSAVSQPINIPDELNSDISLQNLSTMPDNETDGYCIREYSPIAVVKNKGKAVIHSYSIYLFRNRDFSDTIIFSANTPLAPGEQFTWTAPTETVEPFSIGEVEFQVDNVVATNGIEDDNVLNNLTEFRSFKYLSKAAVADVFEHDFEGEQALDAPDQAIQNASEFSLATIVNNELLDALEINDVLKTDPIGGFGLSENSFCYFFWASAEGESSELIFSNINLSNARKNMFLKFDRAYATFSELFPEDDQFYIDVSLDCGVTWENVYTKRAAELITANAVMSFDYPFKPLTEEWVEDSVSISQFAGKPEVMFRMKGVSGFGDNLYVDNFHIPGLISSLQPEINLTSKLEILPNPSRKDLHINYELKSTSDVRIEIQNMDGKTVYHSELKKLPAGEHHFDYTPAVPGIYVVKCSTTEGRMSKRAIVTE